MIGSEPMLKIVGLAQVAQNPLLAVVPLRNLCLPKALFSKFRTHKIKF